MFKKPKKLERNVKIVQRGKRNCVYGTKVVWATILIVCFSVALSCRVERFRKMTVFAYVPKAQQVWLNQHVKKFGLKHNWKIEISTSNKLENLPEILRLETRTGEKNVGLVCVPSEMAKSLVKSGLIKPLIEVCNPEKLETDFSEYLSVARAECKIDGKYYYLPDRLEVFLLFYVKSKVREVVQHWSIYRTQINTLLRNYNRFGLPRGYQLEADPNQWDFFDLVVVGYYFSHTPYDGLLVPRLAHRGRYYAGTVHELVTRIFAMGGNKSNLSSLLADPVVDMLQWESLFVKEQFYHPEMWDSGWAGNEILWQIIRKHVFVAYLQPNELFRINESRQYFDSIGIAVLPKGVSLEIGADGQPQRIGTRKSALHGWYWGIPVTSPDPKFSYKLARFITSFNLQMEAAFSFGSMTVRQDVLDKIVKSSDTSWNYQVFRMGQKQLKTGVEIIPDYLAHGSVGVSLLNLWRDICVQNHLVDRRRIKAVLKTYLEKTKQPSTY